MPAWVSIVVFPGWQVPMVPSHAVNIHIRVVKLCLQTFIYYKISICVMLWSPDSTWLCILETRWTSPEWCHIEWRYIVKLHFDWTVDCEFEKLCSYIGHNSWFHGCFKTQDGKQGSLTHIYRYAHGYLYKVVYEVVSDWEFLLMILYNLTGKRGLYLHNVYALILAVNEIIKIIKVCTSSTLASLMFIYFGRWFFHLMCSKMFAFYLTNWGADPVRDLYSPILPPLDA